MFAAAVAVLVAVRAYRDIRRFNELSEPAYKYWDDVNEFMIFQAAALWEGMEPYDPRADKDPRVAAARTMLKTAVGEGRIVALDHVRIGIVRTDFTRPEINMKTFVSRSELVKLAQMRGEKPRFLYPKQAIAAQ